MSATLPDLAAGRRLQTIRRAYGWPASAVASAASVSPSYVRMWEAGLRPLPAALTRWLQRLPPFVSHTAVYAPTPAGLRRAMAEQRLGNTALSRLLGCTPAAVWQWRMGIAPLNREVRAWLLAGAPVRGYAVCWPPRVDWLNGEVA